MEEKKQKLGLAINAFEGTEHLYNIISEVRDLVDFVVVGLQEKSYLGDPIDKSDVEEVKALMSEGLVDSMIWIETDKTKFTRVQECEKRNKLADCLQENGCTHQLVIDSDEFYTHNAFQRARDYIYDNNVEVSYCRYLNYFGSGRTDDYKTYLVYPFHDGNYVPFIAKIQYRFKWQSRDFPKASDPTRRYERPKVFKRDTEGNVVYKDPSNKTKPVVDHYLADYYEFPWTVLKMHHFSWIRNNIRKKMRDWSSRVYFHEWFELVDRAADRFERFCNGEKEGEAILLFNTPDNKVDLCNMEKQYVFPKVDIHERAKKVPNTDKQVMLENASERSWIDIVHLVAENTDKDWFFLSGFQDITDSVLYVDSIKDIIQLEDDDSKSFADSWEEKTIGGLKTMIPHKCVLVSKTTFMRMLSVDASLLELSGVCTPLEIVGLSLRRYFDNIGIEYRDKMKTLSDTKE